MDFAGPISLASNQKPYILVCTDYVTKWVEDVVVTRATYEVVINFLLELFV